MSDDVDGFHAEHEIVLEVEAGPSAANNADYRDLIRASLMVDARYLVLAMMLHYAGGGPVIKSYDRSRDRIDAIYASGAIQVAARRDSSRRLLRAARATESRRLGLCTAIPSSARVGFARHSEHFRKRVSPI